MWTVISKMLRLWRGNPRLLTLQLHCHKIFAVDGIKPEIMVCLFSRWILQYVWLVCPCHVRPCSVCAGINNPCNLLLWRDSRALRAYVKECQEVSRDRLLQYPADWQEGRKPPEHANKTVTVVKQTDSAASVHSCLLTSKLLLSVRTVHFDIFHSEKVCFVVDKADGSLKWVWKMSSLHPHWPEGWASTACSLLCLTKCTTLSGLPLPCTERQR